ncbi:MAG: Fic family protein [Gemmatimonadota bacterium]|uniref:Fic family protein n=1 Tax=Candidatus Palauibacter scopulicola TaxID=3056741 RepID=UPI00239AC490|nr:Fic family protein [Candidatus Palauibacter scopulicola]MDE2662018.1 Fic family protein [Candidatus Palauibacter scopulicola]
MLAALFRQIDPREIVRMVRAKPTGAYVRRIWFLYEWLLDTRLDLPDAGKVKAVPVVDPKQQFASASGPLSRRHRVRNNLPGTNRFCPLVRRTPELERYSDMRLGEQAQVVVGRTHPDIVRRAAAFLLLEDSQASFQIEGEHPTPDRGLRWGQAIGAAGQRDLGVDELVRLQELVIGDSRFVELGVRTEGGWIGERNRATRDPIPEHISARPDDLPDLMRGVVEYGRMAEETSVDPVISAAALSFGFVYIHPFEDGNGRLHRWLIHHVLARAGYNPPHLVFPVSVPMLRRISEYREVLRSYSSRVLPLVEWRATSGHNVEVLNETGDFYRFFDATAHAEFLYRCVEETVIRDLPDEVAYLEGYDEFARRVQEEVADMPDRTIDLLSTFLRQNGGRLSKRARTREFERLTADEVERVEALYASCFSAEVS